MTEDDVFFSGIRLLSSKDYDELSTAYKKLLNQNINLLHQINNQGNTIVCQREKIKSLSRQINFLNRAIWRYKNGKN